MSNPSRWKSSDGATFTSMYKSPDLPPRAPLSPSPRTRSLSPSEHPAGTWTSTRCPFFSTVPSPRQAVHLAAGSTPPPPHAGHCCRCFMVPRGVGTSSIVTPAPLHLLQVLLPPSSLRPLPMQLPHLSFRLILTDLSPPKHAAFKGKTTWHCRSAPCLGPCSVPRRLRAAPVPLALAPPPTSPWWLPGLSLKKLPKTSPRISSTLTALRSGSAGPVASPCTPASPYRS
mmetsp:Transcript_17814/g.47671  ORF Transcript_17814/g.47671 Transcript_17814/m.47671 type:complete len:228 (+) Transcript_17814:350-1033(+)